MFDRYRFTIFLGAFGALCGIAYAEFIGCETGCTIKSSPFLMALYGVFFGGIIGSWIDDRRRPQQRNEEENTETGVDS